MATKEDLNPKLIDLADSILDDSKEETLDKRMDALKSVTAALLALAKISPKVSDEEPIDGPSLLDMKRQLKGAEKVNGEHPPAIGK